MCRYLCLNERLGVFSKTLVNEGEWQAAAVWCVNNAIRLLCSQPNICDVYVHSIPKARLAVAKMSLQIFIFAGRQTKCVLGNQSYGRMALLHTEEADRIKSATVMKLSPASRDIKSCRRRRESSVNYTPLIDWQRALVTSQPHCLSLLLTTCVVWCL